MKSELIGRDVKSKGIIEIIRNWFMDMDTSNRIRTDLSLEFKEFLFLLGNYTCNVITTLPTK